jgi:hypothetical protein
MRGAFESAKVEAATGYLSIHLSGASFCFEEGWKMGSVCGGDVDGVMFETEQIEMDIKKLTETVFSHTLDERSHVVQAHGGKWFSPHQERKRQR